MTDVSFEGWMKSVQAEMELALVKFLPPVTQKPVRLHEAMHYAVLDGGKRVRPLLVHAAGALFDADAAGLARAAAAGHDLAGQRHQRVCLHPRTAPAHGPRAAGRPAF